MDVTFQPDFAFAGLDGPIHQRSSLFIDRLFRKSGLELVLQA
jgi:hypothetical protein